MVEFLDPVVDVTLADVAIALARLASWFVVVALCALVVAFVYVLLWPLNQLVSGATGGLVGSVPGSHAVEQAVTNALGSAIAAFDAQVGGFWHGLKTLSDETAKELFGLGSTLGYLAWYVTHKFSLGGLIYKVTHLQRVGAITGAAIHAVEREARIAEQLAKSTATHVYPRLGALERDVTQVLQPEITTARDLAKGATDAVASVWDYLKTNPWTAVTDAFVGAVALALTSLGLGGLRCPAFLNSLGNRGCGLFNGLESMLGWLVDLFIITDLCEVIPLLETAYSDVAAPAVALLTDAIDSMPCVAGNQAPALPVPTLYLPAKPALTLALP